MLPNLCSSEQYIFLPLESLDDTALRAPDIPSPLETASSSSLQVRASQHVEWLPLLAMSPMPLPLDLIDCRPSTQLCLSTLTWSRMRRWLFQGPSIRCRRMQSGPQQPLLMSSARLFHSWTLLLVKQPLPRWAIPAHPAFWRPSPCHTYTLNAVKCGALQSAFLMVIPCRRWPLGPCCKEAFLPALISNGDSVVRAMVIPLFGDDQHSTQCTNAMILCSHFLRVGRVSRFLCWVILAEVTWESLDQVVKNCIGLVTFLFLQKRSVFGWLWSTPACFPVNLSLSSIPLLVMKLTAATSVVQPEFLV